MLSFYIYLHCIWFDVRSDCLVCWYLWHCWPPMFDICGIVDHQCLIFVALLTTNVWYLWHCWPPMFKLSFHNCYSDSLNLWAVMKCLYQVRVITVFTVFRLLTGFVCLYTYEFWLSLCKIVRSSVILLLPLFLINPFVSFYNVQWPNIYLKNSLNWYLLYNL